MNYRGKVLVVSEIFWPEGGGAELATYLILKILRNSGYSVTVVTGTDKPMLIKNVKFYYTPLLGNYNRVRRWLGVYILSKRPWFINLLRSHEIVYIPLHAYPLIPIAKKYGRKVIVHMHNYVACSYHGVKYYFEPLKLNVLDELRLGIWHETHAQRSKVRTLLMPVSYSLYKLSKSWLEQADTIVCVSKKQADVIKNRLPKLSKKIAVIYNPLSEELINSNMVLGKRENRILYIGGQSLIKGWLIFLRIALESFKKGFNIKFTALNVRAKILLKNIEVLKRVPHEEMLRLYQQSLALLFPSITEEPLPYSIIESSIMGSIPLAFKIGGVEEILNDTLARRFLAEPIDVNNLIEKFEELIFMDAKERTEIIEDLRSKLISKFHTEKIKERIISVFN